MTIGTCPREAPLLAAARSPAGLDGAARSHAARCPACAAALAAEAALAPLARRPLPAPLPPPSAVLLRARLAERRRALERSVAPLAFWRGLALAAAAAAALAVGGAALVTDSGLAAYAASAPTPARALAGIGLLGLAALPFLGSLRARGAGAP